MNERERLEMLNRTAAGGSISQREPADLGQCDFGGCPHSAITVVVGESGDLHLCAEHKARSLVSEGVCRFCDVVLDGQMHVRFCPLFKGTQ